MQGTKTAPLPNLVLLVSSQILTRFKFKYGSDDLDLKGTPLTCTKII